MQIILKGLMATLATHLTRTVSSTILKVYKRCIAEHIYTHLYLHYVFPGSSYQFYIVSYCVRRVAAPWSYSTGMSFYWCDGLKYMLHVPEVWRLLWTMTVQLPILVLVTYIYNYLASVKTSLTSSRIQSQIWPSLSLNYGTFFPTPQWPTDII